MTLDTTIHLSELFMIAAAGWAILKGGLALRDAVRDMTGAVGRLDKSLHDHEERLRLLELGERRLGERRR